MGHGVGRFLALDNRFYLFLPFRTAHWLQTHDEAVGHIRKQGRAKLIYRDQARLVISSCRADHCALRFFGGKRRIEAQHWTLQLLAICVRRQCPPRGVQDRFVDVCFNACEKEQSVTQPCGGSPPSVEFESSGDSGSFLLFRPTFVEIESEPTRQPIQEFSRCALHTKYSPHSSDPLF